MADPTDPLDRWLAEQAPPMPPPPGTLARIRKRARRRKVTRAAASVAAAVAIVAVGATVPRLAIAQLSSGPGARNGSAAGGVPLGSASPSGNSLPSPNSSRSAIPLPVLPPVPVNFSPVSVTFVGTGTGWALGQAGTPGHCGPPSPGICTSIARTEDGGRTWSGVPAPVAGPPRGSSGVSQIRFLNTQDGWVSGPQLWATHDGGQNWTRIPTHGMRVIGLATAGDSAYALWARCTGTGTGFATGCTGFALYRTGASSNDWHPVTVQGQSLATGQGSGSPPLVLTQTAGYLLMPGGLLVSGRVTGGDWHSVSGALPSGAPCSAGSQGGSAQLASTGSGSLVALCVMPGLGDENPQPVYASANGGSSWQLTGSTGKAGTPSSLSGAPSGGLVLATDRGLAVSSDLGARWRPASVTSAPRGGFSYVGMTTSQQGFAIPADAAQHAIWFTYDGGRDWTPAAIRS
jgi:photosystem II stability/assembly factor-like uncharacterized protein